jgi:tetratricopeptide (TPR) repeat protein
MTAQRYLALAQQVEQQPADAARLLAAVAAFPPLDTPLFIALSEQVAADAGHYPRRAWAIAAVADAAAARLGNEHLWLKAQAAWQLSRAANEWVRPDLVDEPLQRARAGFTALGDQGWLAACDWQEHALPWTRNNFAHSAAVLQTAAVGLEAAGLDDFAAHCRLSLALAQAVLWQFEAAAETVALAEATFAAAGDEANLARCLLVRSSYLRRQSAFDAALACLAEAESIFRRLELPLDLAKTNFQLGHCRWQRHNDPAAITAFEQAAHLFQERDLPLWFAQCQGGLAEIHHYQGQLDAADAALTAARAIYSRFPIYGLRADNLFESGTLAMLYGRYRDSLDYFRQAKSLYLQVSVPYMAALVAMCEGEVYTRLGRYQQALPALEQAHQMLAAAGTAGRLVECEIRLAQLWLLLERPDLALGYLETAASHSEQTQQPAFLAGLCYFQAELFLRQQQPEAALNRYRQALAATEGNGLLPEIAFARRLLGEALCFLGRPDEAGDYLQSAAAIFSERGLVMELALCQVALGRYFTLVGDTAAARLAWQAAADLAQDALPDISWQAAAGLAALVEAEGETAAALGWFEQAIEALSRVRRNFWQPSLIGRYLHRPAETLNQAIRLAAQAAPATTLLRFVEESKAQISATQLRQADWSARRSQAAVALGQELASLKADLEWLYEQSRADSSAPIPAIRTTSNAYTLQQLKEKTHAYDTTLARLERESLTGLPASLPGSPFDLADFRAIANDRLGRHWLALDYYLTATHLTAVIITPEACFTDHRPLNGPTRLLLTLLERGSQSGQALDAAQLATLGQALLPPLVRERLEPDCYLLIAPHRQLHRLPWPALLLDGPGSPRLVEQAIPVITPSLQTLRLLWQRPESHPETATGLLLALSTFANERRPPLPAVRDEAEQLKGQAALALCEQEATWPNLLALCQENGLARFAFLHVASHAFADPVSGRASGLALYDQDIWLDQLWEVAPLPALVTLSACSGAQSVTHQGDEHVGLATTCLAAGANQVIASLWPVLDPAAARLMADFYGHYAAGRSPAAALAYAQRAQSGPPSLWSGFLCLGRP